MPPPFSDDIVEYEDGTSATVDQLAKDMVVFLAWAAEPEMEERKKLGIRVIIFLSVLTILLAFIKRKVWEKLKIGFLEVPKKTSYPTVGIIGEVVLMKLMVLEKFIGEKLIHHSENLPIIYVLAS